MIKEFAEPVDCHDVVFVSLCIPDCMNELYYIDSILECALSVSYTFMLRQQQHYIAWYDANSGICRRVKIVQEKDFYEAVDGLFNVRSFHIDTDALMTYLAEYPNDKYSDFMYITGKFEEAQLDKLADIQAQGKNIIYLSDSESLADAKYTDEEMAQKAASLGVDFLPVDMTNVKHDLEFL